MAIICHCEVVRDRDIVAAIEAGACSIEQVRTACGAVTGCGACEPAVVDLLRRSGIAVEGTPAVADSCVFVSPGTA